MPGPYRLGLPVWANPAWRGGLFRRLARPSDYLGQYAAAFDAVEGNTTFYHAPDDATVQRWRARTPPGFAFCFKMPRQISHELRLAGAARDLALGFMDTLAPLADRMGPTLVQLPPDFGPGEVDALIRFLEALPTAPGGYAVEVRHPRLHGDGAAEHALEAALTALGVDRAFMDTRALRTTPDEHPDARDARTRKPNLARRPYCTGPRPFVRFVGTREVAPNGPWLDEWAGTVARWIGEGRTPHFFVHTPGDLWAPQVARAFHERLALRLGLGPLGDFAGEAEPSAEQLSLL
ncbi:MAG: DUF72 domain-containing protein [Myxococcales bacterium]|nr:DUF72 domain-containing protein [Myxococcales bacterium]MCB9526032.1 DUF72 domain-containing protein [Myxococcales bacterium]